jgi:hypothetical protein
MHPCFSPAFCEQLEWQLSAALSRSPTRSRRRYWCDGILAPEWAEDYQPEYVRRTRQIRLRAWIDQGPAKGGGASEQNVWPLTMQLGPQAYAAYRQNKELTPYIPGHDDWVLLDPDSQRLTAQLL